MKNLVNFVCSLNIILHSFWSVYEAYVELGRNHYKRKKQKNTPKKQGSKIVCTLWAQHCKINMHEKMSKGK